MIQTQQNPKVQNTNCENINVTKYKCNKIQIEQNSKIPKYKHDIHDLRGGNTPLPLNRPKNQGLRVKHGRTLKYRLL